MHRSFNYRKGKGASVPNAQPTTARWSFPSLLPAHDLNCNDNRNGLTTIPHNSGGLRGSYHSDGSSRFFMEVSVLGEQSGRGKKKLLLVLVNRSSMMRLPRRPTEPRRPPGLTPLHGPNLIFAREVNGTICLACLSRACEFRAQDHLTHCKPWRKYSRD